MTGFILFTNTDKVTEEPKEEELERSTSMKHHLLDNVKSDDFKIMLRSMAKIVVYYEQVEWLQDAGWNILLQLNELVVKSVFDNCRKCSKVKEMRYK